MSEKAVDGAMKIAGHRASMALDAVELAIWKRSASIIQQAESLLDDAQLTPQAAQTLFIQLIEQGKMACSLRVQIKEGIDASHRMNVRADKIAAAAEEEKRVKREGRNRFHRSKVG